VVYGIALAILLPSASATHAGEPPGIPLSPAAVSERIQEAEEARLRAAEMDAEWLETGNLIQRARLEADQGNWQQATALADQALQQAELAVAQAERESEAWRARVIR
jgi:hypothetical protein